jgi:VanZ family protein
MRTDNEGRRVSRWCLLCAAVLVTQIFSLSSLPFELREPMDKVFHGLAYGSLTMMLWIATGGRRPVLLVVGMMALGLVDEVRQSFIPTRTADVMDFVADALAAGLVGAVMYWKQGARKPCAESSARSRAET